MHKCIDCKTTKLYRTSKRCRECYLKIAKERFSKTGKESVNWKGGTHINDWGYERFNPTAKYKGKDVGGKFVHRVILEEKLGRELEENERTHHINGDKLDNRPENLEAITIKEHNKVHKPHLGNSKRHPKFGYYIKKDADPENYEKPNRKRDPETGRFI